ncbi:MAG: stage II sporulation protein M [Clostridiales bacterium]|nr:stage II sporulation protein M [Clostridiales bacterium]
MNRLMESFHNGFREHKLYYLLVLLLFCIGIVIGICTVKYMDPTNKSDVTSYFNTFVNGASERTTDYGDLFLKVLKKNMLLLIPIILLSLTFFGAPLILICDLVKGFTLGYTFTFLLTTFNGKGFILALASVIPQNLFYIPCYIAISVIGINMSNKTLKERFLKSPVKSKIEKIKNISNSLVMILIFFIIGVMVETYLGPNIIKFVLEKFYTS